MGRPTLQQQLAAAELRTNKLRAQLSEATRKADTRRKIVIGGTVLAAIEEDADLRGRVLALLREKVTRPLDREAVAELLGESGGVALGDAEGDTAQPAAA